MFRHIVRNFSPYNYRSLGKTSFDALCAIHLSDPNQQSGLGFRLHLHRERRHLLELLVPRQQVGEVAVAAELRYFEAGF